MKKRTGTYVCLFAFLVLFTFNSHCSDGKKEKMPKEDQNICVWIIGEKDSMVVKDLPQFLESAFNHKIKIFEKEMNLDFAYNPQRKQYHSSKILKKLNTLKETECEHLLAIVAVDLFVPELNFVFGEADFQTKMALISIVRLRQELYGLPENKNLFVERVVKEAVHELGHTYGLPHCENRKCAMHFSNSLWDTDFKSYSFCEFCKERLELGKR